MLAAGVALFIVGTFYPQISKAFATVYTDSTPPVLSSFYPDNGVYSSISSVQCTAGDPESGVTSVTATVDGGQPVTLTKVIGDAYSGEVMRALVTALATGNHTVEYDATNAVGLTAKYTANVQIFAGLQGNWYINNIQVTSASQTLYFNTTTLTFKFVKTLGAAPDTAISCMIVEGQTTDGTLTYQGSETWTGTVTFSGGIHTLALKASDGTSTVTMQLLNVDFGGVTFSDTQIGFYGGGFVCFGIGGYGFFKRRRG